MTEKEIKKANKLISEFDGLRDTEFNEYLNSYDWMIPVLEKIRKIEDWDFQIGVIGGDGNFCKIERHSSLSTNSISFRGYTKNRNESFILCIVQCVVEFIKWYNNENKNKTKDTE